MWLFVNLQNWLFFWTTVTKKQTELNFVSDCSILSDWYFHLLIIKLRPKFEFNFTNPPLNSSVLQLSTSIPQTTDAQWRCNGTALQINRHNYIVVDWTPVSVWLSVLYLSRRISLARTRGQITGKAFTELRKLGLRSECILCPGRCVLDSIKSDNNAARVRHLAIWHRNEIFPRGSSWRMFTDLWLKVSRFRNFLQVLTEATANFRMTHSLRPAATSRGSAEWDIYRFYYPGNNCRPGGPGPYHTAVASQFQSLSQSRWIIAKQ